MKKTTYKTLSVFDLIEKIVYGTYSIEKIAIPKEIRPYVAELARRLGITQMQALMLSVLVNLSDDSSIRARDIARHFDCKTIAVLANQKYINELVRMEAVARRVDNDGEVAYRVPTKTLDALQNGRMPEKQCIDNLSAMELFTAIEDALRKRDDNEYKDEDLYDALHDLLEHNQQLDFARNLKTIGLDDSDLVLYLATAKCFVDNNDDRVGYGDVDDYFERGTIRRHCTELQSGCHILMLGGLLEHSCDDGQVDAEHWRLTDYSKMQIFTDLNLKKPVDMRSNLTRHEDIKAQDLFYTPAVDKQVRQLELLLDEERMKRVMTRLADKGLRKGIACLMYGGPGTGKTATAMQLARKTGRDVMLVDIPSIRDKWVGETEKNIKGVFDRYRKAVESCSKAPILLFNEADALLNRRTESSSSVDKMENAMQNIILQEMENFEGIMLATTNLTCNLDPAFERRFLYKIEFDRPGPEQRMHIWMALLPDLKESDARTLAEKYDFSGGQIENIARKRIIGDILADRDDIDLDSIVESCNNELILKQKKISHVGF